MAWFKGSGQGRGTRTTGQPTQDGNPTAKSSRAEAVQQCGRRFKPQRDWRMPKPNDLRIQAWYQPIIREGKPDPQPSRDANIEVSLPLRLQFTGSRSGAPDLRLQLLSLKSGAACEHNSSHTLALPQARLSGLTGVADCASKAGTLLFLKLIFPDELQGSTGPLIALGAFSMVGRAALATKVQRDQALRQLRQRTSAVPYRLRRAAGQVAQGAWPAAKQIGQLPGDYVSPAAALWVGAHMWAWLSPHTYHVLQCLAASVPLMAGYAQTGRAAALGRIAPGEATEEAFRARHRWAARRVAHLLKGLPDRPPLQTASEVLESASVNIGLSVEGQPFLGSSVDLLSAAGGVAGASWSVSASLPTRRCSKDPLPNPPAPPPSVAPPPKTAHQHEQPQASTSDAGSHRAQDVYVSDATGRQFATSQLPTITSRADLDSCMASSSGRLGSSPFSSEPGTPVRQSHGPHGSHAFGGQKARAVQDSPGPSGGAAWDSPGPSTGAVSDDPSTSSSWADSAPTLHHRVGPRIAELQRQTDLSSHPAGLAGAQHDDERQPHGGGTMLLSEVDFARAGPSQAAPSSEVRLSNGQTVSITGNDAGTEAAPLYGRGDHAAQDRALSVRDKCDLVLRASFLVTVFLPFLLLGPLLLLLASTVAPSPPAQAQAASLAAGSSAQPASHQQAAPAQKNLGNASELGAVMTPQTTPSRAQGVGLASQLRTAAFKLLLLGCRSSGAAFIKWGQWSSTREDIFPADFCRVLSELHDKAPVHKWEASRAAIETAFGQPVEQLFEWIDHSAIASGSIAQVHKAIMTIEGVRRVVAVKVRHPGVADIIRRDFQVLKPVAAATSRVRALKGLSLKESVSQFSSTMTAQADLRVECAHLRRFYNNFASVSQSVTPPYPFPGCETAEVLIETFEPGESVAKYIREPSPFNTQIVSLGVDTYLKMLLADNFVHTDLHPGNIMVRIRGTDKVEAEKKSLAEIRSQLQLVLLDFGLAEELTPRVRKHFISFLHMISSGNGRRAAHHMLLFSTNQECPRPEAFADDMEALFNAESQINAPEGIDVDKVLKDVLKLARRHEVGIDSSYAALVLGVCVIVGFATSLDRRINIMDAATPCFLQHSLTGKATGRLY